MRLVPSEVLEAKQADHYVVIPAYGCPEDAADPLAWVRLVEQAVGPAPAAE